MRSMIDFSSWSSVLSTVAGLLLVTCLMMGVRLLFMQTVQKRRERENRQINERLKTLMAAYKTLGSSFTGQLQVRPTHMRDLRLQQQAARTPAADGVEDQGEAPDSNDAPLSSSERQRRMRDTVEAALSDVILLGTEEQVRMAAQAALDMTEGRSIHTRELVVSLRNFIREALNLEPIPADVRVPDQGPLRPSASGGAGGRRGGAGGGEGTAGGGHGGGGGGGGQGGGGGMGAMGLGLGMGAGAHHASSPADPTSDEARLP
ncbi:hypothetical protein [Diaphorobacter aerolatus]|uniref:Uncharacterized protein n=1 Tax=Diaphorobacter aerolatus TaxID=1288495 RepID=A0A7H0GKP7_9BURK|nr:hypothetical protein [Diaphorobacter aerolatus]QNP48863.1 hypothetical protein H9K75_01215 [Diaphorobacter aerolatus]